MAKDKCSCNSKNHHHDHDCNCNHDHHDHHHDENCNCENEGFGSVQYEDENGNVIDYPIVDCFSVEGVEYVLIQDVDDNSTFMLKVDGEELVNPTDEEFDRVTKIYYEDEE